MFVEVGWFVSEAGLMGVVCCGITRMRPGGGGVLIRGTCIRWPRAALFQRVDMLALQQQPAWDKLITGSDNDHYF